MEYYKNVRTSSSQQQNIIKKRFFRTSDLIRENYQYFERRSDNIIKRNLKGGTASGSVNSDILLNNYNNHHHENVANNINDNNNNNNLITYEHLSESWIELVLPFTILAITILAVIFIAVILFIWIHKYYREKREQSQIDRKVGQQSKSIIYCTKKRCDKNISNNNRNKMNSRKWLKGKSKKIDNQIVNDLEQKLETIEFKSTPPTSPNSQKLSEEQQHDESEETNGGSCESKIEKDSPPGSTTIIPCPLSIGDISITSIIQPPQTSVVSSLSTAELSPTIAPSSSLSLLQEEVHCIQPKEEQSTKIYKSIATSPPPFSPFVSSSSSSTTAHQQHKYATTGTQTYFTKAPNSPNNLLSSSFAVLQTPTTSSSSSNPFIISPSDNNKENKEPSSSKLRNICLNKTISSFKYENSSTICSSNPTSSSNASSPSSVISTSPKVNTNVLQQQNSPVICDSPTFNQHFNFSPKVANAHTNTGSPPISVTTQKMGNYFRFPDIETPPATTAVMKTEKSDSDVPIITKAFSNLSMDGETSTKESIILKIDEVESPPAVTPAVFSGSSVDDCTGSKTINNNNVHNNNLNNNNNNNNSENTLTIRRARLKSISLDSDGARLVEENLTMPVEELVEIASYNNKQIKESDICVAAASCANNNLNNNNRFNPKNIYNLTINLDFRDSSLDITDNSDINMNQQDQEYDESEDGICRTPTMKYFMQKKAVSLDSDNQEGNKNMLQQQFPGKTASSETFNYYFGQSSNKMNSSISVPSTPKHLTSNKLKLSTSEDRSSSTHGSSSISGRYNRKLGSFEENADDSNKLLSVTSHPSNYKSNLTSSTLNISSSNLKTLPEIMSINDFDGNSSQSSLKPRPATSTASIAKSGILQRRGSNHSLTIDGSCGNLMRGLSCSNYSLGNIHGSHLNIAGSNYNLQPNHRVVTVKKNLLQRRGSNTSLTLNIQGSNNNLNRFNSHSSLNITGNSSQKKGLLERRNSNASLTLNIQNRGLSISNCNLRGSECSLSSVNTNQMAEMMMLEQEHQEAENQEKANNEKYAAQRHHHRKFLSSENLHNIRSSTAMSMANTHRQQSQHPTPYGSIDNLKQTQPYEKVPVISTKPLSPQSTSEDFKIYLANIQFLQSASNVLDESNLRTLNELFQKSYKNHPKDQITPASRQFNNDDILNSKIGTDGPLITACCSSPDEDQKQLLIKLHQEFWNLPTNYQEKPMVFGSQSKNRYKTILPNEHSRVILQKEEGVQQEPYINANFIKGPDYTTDCYIATQGPMPNTVYEFWLMILQNIEKKSNEGIQKIAMLTDFVESQRQKCAVYFPKDTDDFEVFTNSVLAKDENLIRENINVILDMTTDEKQMEADDENVKQLPKISCNYFIIKNIGLKQKNGYSIRKLLLHYANHYTNKTQQYKVYHYWFRNWPDHRSPQDIRGLLTMSLDLLDGDCATDFDVDDVVDAAKSSPSKNPLPIIHCSAGIGRTGCLAAILNGLGQLRMNAVSGEGMSVDILGIVCNLRLQRGGMVQNSEQYELIHRSLCLYQQKLRKN